MNTHAEQVMDDFGSPSIPGPSSFLGIDSFLKLNRLGFLDFLYQLWEEYGDIYRFKIGHQDMMVASSPNAIRQISLEKDYFTKGKNYDLIRRYAGGRNLLTSVGDDWLWQRRLMADLFTPKAVSTFADLMMEECYAMFEAWEALPDENPQLDIETEMFNLTANITLRSIFGSDGVESFESIKDDVATLVQFLTKRQQAIVQMPLWFPSKFIQKYNAAHKRLYDFLTNIVTTRLSQSPDTWPDDMLGRILKAEDENGKSMSQQMVKDQSLTFFVAGHDPAALTMIFALYELSRNPDVEAKLIDEIDRITEGRLPTLDDMRQMSYTLRVIKEAMRLYPPVPYYPRDVVQDTLLDGYPVKAGDSILVFPYATHRHPEYWDNPDVFEPERFAPELEKQRHSQAYIPFGSGRRICIGNHFALLETQILLSTIYSRYRVRLVEGHVPDIVATGMLQLKTGMPMYLEKR